MIHVYFVIRFVFSPSASFELVTPDSTQLCQNPTAIRPNIQ